MKYAAVVGSGPSGFYATEALLNAFPNVVVDMFERLPTPYGLVRSGVAPDHPKLKQVTLVFDKIMQSDRFHFFGNISVGLDVSIDALRETYDAVVLAYGASSDRKMGIPGEELANSHSATEFVGWYNGHPDFRDRTFDLSHEVAVVVGHGNVAADVARILLQPADDLRRTDIAAHALEILAESKVREVHLVGRRGPVQAKFTARELRGLGQIRNSMASAHGDEIKLGAACEVELADRSNLNVLQNVEFFRDISVPRDFGTPKRLAFRFHLTPERLEGEGRVEKFVLRRSALIGPPFSQQAVVTDEIVTIGCGLIFSSIGYKGRPIMGVPFDASRAIVPNRKGRVEYEGTPLERLYVTGWLKRGPTGIIGTNRADSIETVQQIIEDISNHPFEARRSRNVLVDELAESRPVGMADWLRIDAAERRRGQQAGKPREKFTRVAEMLDEARMHHESPR